MLDLRLLITVQIYAVILIDEDSPICHITLHTTSTLDGMRGKNGHEKKLVRDKGIHT